MQRTYKPTFDLLRTPVFSQKQLTPVKAALRSYERAKAIGLAYSAFIPFYSDRMDFDQAIDRTVYRRCRQLVGQILEHAPGLYGSGRRQRYHNLDYTIQPRCRDIDSVPIRKRGSQIPY